MHQQLQTPVPAILVSSFFALFLALFLDIELLAELVSVGTLFAFTLVCLCVMLLRFKPTFEYNNNTRREDTTNNILRTGLLLLFYLVGLVIVAASIVADAPYWLPLLLSPFILIPAFLLFWYPGIGLIDYKIYISQGHFLCPLVPILPMCGMAINVYMIANLRASTFAGFGLWLVIGFIIYFIYGYRHSQLVEENKRLLTMADDDIVMYEFRK